MCSWKNNNFDFETIWDFSAGLNSINEIFLVPCLFADPPDTVKSRLQVQGANGSTLKYRSTADAFAKIFRSEGISGFYRGFGAILVTVVPANMCYFSGYELGKRLAPPDWGISADIFTAVVAQTIAGIAFCPIDIVKQRVQTAQVMNTSLTNTSVAQHITPFRAACDVWNFQGLSGFYRGFWAMNALWMPWNLIYISMYESLKRRIYRRKQCSEKMLPIDGPNDHEVLQVPPMTQALPLWAFPVCSSTSAAIAAIITHPIDVVKTRLQVLSASRSSESSKSAFEVANELWKLEGAHGFTRGLLPRVATLSVGSSVSWFVYEMVKRNLQ